MGDDKTPEEQRLWTRAFNRASKQGARTCAEAASEADAVIALERKKVAQATAEVKNELP